jgi:hypothetical protein
MIHLLCKFLFALALLSELSFAQSLSDLVTVATPRSLELSGDGSRLWYQIGQAWWEVETRPGSAPKRLSQHTPAAVEKRRVSPDSKKAAYLSDYRVDKDAYVGPALLFCDCVAQSGPRAISRKPVLDFQWADDSNSLWVIAVDGADEPVGRMTLDGVFRKSSLGPALRRRGGFAAANGVVAWVSARR